MWPYEGERIEVEVQASDDAPPVWVASEVRMVLVDGQFQARIVLPDGSDRWEDWFSWQDEGTDWRRREHAKAPPKKRTSNPNPTPTPNPNPHPHPNQGAAEEAEV